MHPLFLDGLLFLRILSSVFRGAVGVPAKVDDVPNEVKPSIMPEQTEDPSSSNGSEPVPLALLGRAALIVVALHSVM